MTQYTKLIRKFKGSVRKEAKKLGVSPTTFYRLRRGELPDPGTLRKLMNAVGTKSVTINIEDLGTLGHVDSQKRGLTAVVMKVMGMSAPPTNRES